MSGRHVLITQAQYDELAARGPVPGWVRVDDAVARFTAAVERNAVVWSATADALERTNISLTVATAETAILRAEDALLRAHGWIPAEDADDAWSQANQECRRPGDWVRPGVESFWDRARALQEVVHDAQ